MRLLILFIFFLPTTVYAHGTIIITNVEHDEGYIDLKIYNNKENFLKEYLAIESVRKKAVKGQTILPLTKIHEGKIEVGKINEAIKKYKIDPNKPEPTTI